MGTCTNNPAEILKDIAEMWIQETCFTLDHETFVNAAEYLEQEITPSDYVALQAEMARNRPTKNQ